MLPSNRVPGALVAALLPLVAACGTVTVRVPVMRPAEINMGPYSSVAVGEIRGRGDTRALSDGLEEALVNTQRFQVVDRAHMASTMKELQLSSTDLADPKKAARLGQIVTAGALIFADLEERYQENPTEERYQDKDKKEHVRRTISGEATVRSTFKIVDVSTGRVLISKTYEERKRDSNSAVDERPRAIDRDQLTINARRSVVDRFMKAIVPHQESVDAHFLKDSDIPQLEGGIGWAERGTWDKAKEAFNNAIQDAEKNPKIGAKQLSKAYFDLGLAYEYSADFDSASKMVQKAYDLGQEGDYLNELDSIKRLQSDARKLAEQTAHSEGAGGR